MSNVLVTGANRGIGLGLVRAFLKDNKIEHLFATCRDPQGAQELKGLNDSRLKIVKMEATCDDSIQEAYKEVEKVVGEKGLNILVNNAGILVNYRSDQKPDRSVVTKQLEVNATSVLIVSQYFLPLLKQSARTTHESKILNISSDLGSIGAGMCQAGSTPKGFLAYRMSKSAVNSMTKCMAVDLVNDGILTAAYHPGWVATDMGGTEAPTTIDESATDLVETFSRLTKEDTGKYFDRKGKVIPY